MCLDILDIPMERGISLEKAISLVQKGRKELSAETIHLDDSHGRILAAPLVSKVNDPRFDNSAMDGWAVRKEDILFDKNNALSIVGISKAGGKTPPPIGSGEACKIMTGAPIPPGADAIVMVEDSEV